MEITDVRSRLQQLRIVNKAGKVVPLIPNDIQRHYLGHETLRDIVVKPRQVGFSTLKLGELYLRATSNWYVNAVLISHEREATRRLFKVLKRFYDLTPEEDRPEVTDWNKDTIRFADIESTIYIGTAGARKFGRGDAVHMLHASEVAFWENDEENLSAILQSVPADGYVTLESTPNGASGRFWEMYTEAYTGGSPYKNHFFPWWMDSSYRMPVGESFIPSEDEERLMKLHHLTAEQIMWRRFKQAELKGLFPQEYPEDPLDCFLMTGGHVFDSNVLRDMVKLCREPDICEDDGFGTLKIWDKPRTGMGYVIGADAGEGHAGGDLSAAVVLEHQTGRHVASLSGIWPPDHFAGKLEKLGFLYNTAYVGCEANGPGQMVLHYLDEILHYPNLHMTFNEHFTEWELGWKTSFVNKPTMVLHCDEIIRHRACITYDADLVGQFRNYRRVKLKTQNRYEAAGKGHDDLLMAFIIAMEVRPDASFGQRAAPRRVG